ncbi:organic anion transporter 3-like [Argopecten irradians]|uniref:organic anion transporter 3-like n=1 Tax=Argopecten irradians TaxID=31199 RepID=UPI003722DD06
MKMEENIPINEFLDEILDKYGGFGRFQVFIMAVVLGSMCSVVFSMMMMTFAGSTPDWNCITDDYHVHHGVTGPTSFNDTANKCSLSFGNHTTGCHDFRFSNSMDTIVNEWDLVCDKAWIPSTITTIQMAGVLLGGLFSGHLADKIGRKPTYFLSLLFLMVFNMICGFSITWEMFATCRLFLGLGMGGYLTIFYPYVLEFIPKERRAVLATIPMWAIWSTIFAFIAMGIHDWKNLHFVSAIVVAPWFFFWWSMPESFRWLVSNNKEDAALKVIQNMAKFNRKPIQDMKAIEMRIVTDVRDTDVTRTYSIKDMFVSAELTKMTGLHVISWLACGYGYYGVSFEVKGLTGNLYLNMALLSIVEIPTVLATYTLTNRLGRKWTALLFSSIGAFAAVVMAFIEITGLQNHVYRTVFPLISKIGVSMAWLCIKLLSIEMFPTVIRSVSSGVFNATARIGSLIAPQCVFLNDSIPGLLYFICSGLLMSAFLCVCFMPETKNKHLPDTLSDFSSRAKNQKTKHHPLKLFNNTPAKMENNDITYITHL